MPLTDRPEFLAWLANHQEHSRALGIPPGDKPSCQSCGTPAKRQAILGEHCVVCLAGMFATDQVHHRLAAILRTFAATASDPDPDALARLLASVFDRLEDAISDQPAVTA